MVKMQSCGIYFKTGKPGIMSQLPVRSLLIILILCFGAAIHANGQDTTIAVGQRTAKPKIQYGIASFYSNKFQGRKTSSGELFSQTKLTAAHNTLPLGTYIRVTNLRNKKSVVVKVNDRLHHRNKRLVDLSRTAAERLGFIKSGTTRVKVEVLGKKPLKT
jgi:rare lipoprotein A